MKGEVINTTTQGHTPDRQGVLETMPKTPNLHSLPMGQQDAPGTSLGRDNLYLCLYESCWVHADAVEGSTLSMAGCVAKSECVPVCVCVLSGIHTQLQG